MLACRVRGSSRVLSQGRQARLSVALLCCRSCPPCVYMYGMCVFVLGSMRRWSVSSSNIKASNGRLAGKEATHAAREGPLAHTSSPVYPFHPSKHTPHRVGTIRSLSRRVQSNKEWRSRHPA